MKTPHFFTDLTQRPPRSFRVRLGNYVILARMLDKGRATLAGKNGKYQYNSPTDQRLVQFLGFDPDALLEELSTGKGDGEILEWVQAHSKTPRAGWEIGAWSAFMDKRAPGHRRRNTGLLCRTPGPAFQNPGRRQNLVRIRRTR